MYSSLWICIPLIFIGIFNRANTVHNGESVQDDEFPYIVSLVGNFDDPHECGGVIITEIHILTAAHCVIDHGNRPLFILAGSFDRKDFLQKAIMRIVQRVYTHPNYTKIEQSPFRAIRLERIFFPWRKHKAEMMSRNDIAVLKLNEPLRLGREINTAKLPRDNELPYCEITKYAGWGQMGDTNLPSILQWIYMIILPPEDCQSKWMPHSDREFCAIDPSQQARPAYGDSGSPYVVQNVVYGITARGKQIPSRPFIFTKVFSYLRFIEEALRQ